MKTDIASVTSAGYAWDEIRYQVEIKDNIKLNPVPADTKDERHFTKTFTFRIFIIPYLEWWHEN